MPRNGDGHNTGDSLGRIDSQSMSAEEIADKLDFLLATQRLPKEGKQFPHLVRLLDGVNKVNPHQHITGSIGGRALLKRVIQTYQQDPKASAAFLDYVASRRMLQEDELGSFFLQPQNDLLDWFERNIPLPGDPDDFKEADDRLDLTRLAFQSADETSLELLKEAYRTVALENSAHGVTEVWFRTSLGDHESDAFLRAAQAALAGAREVNRQSNTPIRVRFLIGMRKHHPNSPDDIRDGTPTDARAEDMVAAVTQLGQKIPQAQALVLGIDSVGMDSYWQPQWQATARRAAAEHRLHVAVHFGESWDEGELPYRLEMLQDLVQHGIIHQLDNANALFAVKDLLNPRQWYSNDQWAEIGRLQHAIFETLTQRGIALGINPTSNDLLTRSLRRREGWRFRALTTPIDVGRASVSDLMLDTGRGRRPLTIVVGNDNSRLYPSRISGSFLTVSEELANLWGAPGSKEFSVYGKLPTKIIAQFIRNGFNLTQSAGGDVTNNSRRPRAISVKPAAAEVSDGLYSDGTLPDASDSIMSNGKVADSDYAAESPSRELDPKK